MNTTSQISHDGAVPEPAWKGNRYPAYEDARLTMISSDAGMDILRKIWRRKGLIAVVTAAFTLIGAVLATVLTPIYTGESRVLIGVEEPRVANIEAILKNVTPNAETVQSEAFVVASRDLARKVGYRLALDKSPEFNPSLRELEWYDYINPMQMINFRAISNWFQNKTRRSTGGASPEPEVALTREERLWQIIDSRLLNRVDVTPLNRSHVIAITGQSEEPVTAARIANTFGDVYVEQQLARKRQAADQANQWLGTRIKELQANVQEAERAVETYRRAHGLYQTKSDTVVAQQLGALSNELVEAENQRAQADARLAQAEALKNNPDGAAGLPSVMQSAGIQMLRSKQADLERDAADLAATFTDKHPKVRNIRAQIQDVRGKIKEEIQRVIEGLQNEAKVARDRLRRVQIRMDSIKGEMGVSNEQTVELRDLERQADASRVMLEGLLKRSAETAEQPLQTPDAAVISRAGVPLQPSFPPINLVIVLAAFVGIASGVLIALLLENLDETFRTAEEVEEYTGLPALTLLPKVDKTRRHIGHVIRNPYSTFTDGLRMLSARLSIGTDGNAMPKLVMFTSALPGEGKSFSSSAFAQLLALDGHRVILLDLDWKKPMLHRIFRQPSGPGLVDLLNRDVTPEQAVFHDPQSGAHVMFAGNTARIRGMSARVEWLRLLLHTLSRHYDVVILDAPPVMFSPEVLYLAPMADKTILTVKWGTTPRRVVAAELKNLARAGVKVPGIVLSQVDPRRYTKYSYQDSGFLRHRYLATTAR